MAHQQCHESDINIQGLETDWSQEVFGQFLAAVQKHQNQIDPYLVEAITRLNRRGTEWAGQVRMQVDVNCADVRDTQDIMRLYKTERIDGHYDRHVTRLYLTLSQLTQLLLKPGMTYMAASPSPR